MEQKEKCKFHVRSKERFPGFGHPCTRNAWKDGFCKTHHPDSFKIREEKRKGELEEKLQNSFHAQLMRASEKIKELEKENEELKTQLQIAYAHGESKLF